MIHNKELQKSNSKFSHVFWAYTGAFLFAVILIVLIHETGHYLAFRWRGYDASVRINPFMGTTSSQQDVQTKDLTYIVLGGPVFDLFIAATVTILLRSTRKKNLDLQSDHRLRRLDRRSARPGRLVLEPEGVVAQFEDGRRRTIRHEELCSVLVEGNRKLELSYRTSNGEGGYLFFVPPQRYAVFLQHFLRRQAFGSPYSRYRGSRRVDLDEL